MTQTAVREVFELGFPWKTFDPFLFCVHHLDHYPRGNAAMGPDASLAGREIGMDFAGKDGWRMYHGETIPGFPRHPHRGFETVTLARRGTIDHSDSLGATARFGHGDTQWMTAGRGIVHAEMFPLLSQEDPNPVELFQLWLNLPRASKMTEPHFEMLWAEKTPTPSFVDEAGRTTRVRVVAGQLGAHVPPSPPPGSWASRPEGAVAIWTIELEAHATWTLPAGPADVHRTLYFFDGDAIVVADQRFQEPCGIRLRPDTVTTLAAGDQPAQLLLLLQGRPLNEPIAHYGPFVMNTPAELQQAMSDYRRTGFGGWPWSEDGPVHPRSSARFALRPDGIREEPPTAAGPTSVG